MSAVEQVIIRTNPGVDPHLDVWEWQIPVYLFLGGLVAGLMVIGAWQELRQKERWPLRLSTVGALGSLLLLSGGMLALFLDLANPEYVYRFYLSFQPTSPMSWGAWLLLFTYPALVLWGLGGVTDEQFAAVAKRLRPVRWLRPVWRWAVDHRSLVLNSILAMGLGLGVYTGILLQTLVARPLWNSGLLAPLFLASGVSAGAALYMLFQPARPTLKSLLRLDIAALSIEAVLLLLLVLEKSSGGPADRAAAKMLVGGAYTGTFFGVVVAAGIIVPLLMETLELRNRRYHALLAPALILVGSFTLRAVLVLAGLDSSVQLY